MRHVFSGALLLKNGTKGLIYDNTWQQDRFIKPKTKTKFFSSTYELEENKKMHNK